jgi:hypothetical protein
VKTSNHENPDFRDLFPSPPSSEIEAACLYEYMRESQTLRGALNASTEKERRKIGSQLVTPFFLSFTEDRFFRLMVALQEAGFPKPWKRLSKPSQKQLVALLAESMERTMRRDKRLYPPVIIEQGWQEFDYSENCWRVGQLQPFELSLFKRWEHSGRKCFFGFIRIDRAYSETEAVEAFTNEFRKHWPKTRGGGGAKWRERLKQLAVMRICAHERKRSAGDYIKQWKRVQLVAEFCGYHGCVKEAAAYEKRCEEGRGDESMSKAAKVEISSACSEARKFFQSLFPREEPLSY